MSDEGRLRVVAALILVCAVLLVALAVLDVWRLAVGR